MKDTKNWKSFKNGRRMPGYITRSMPLERKKKDPAAEDRENRKEVVKEIMERVNNGEKLQEACNELVEKYKDKFKYLPVESLSNIFAGWYNGRLRPRKEVEKEI